MIDFSVALLFAGACLALTLTPGPDMLLIASRSMSQGRASGFVSLAGIQAGTYCHALAAALGLSQLLIAVPTAYDVVRFAGAAYLAFLAWKAFTSTASPLVASGSLASTPLARIFRQGLFTNLLNPKMALFVLALFPQFVDPTKGSVIAQMLIFATILNVIGLFVNGSVIVLASKLGSKLSANARIAKALNQLLGAVFIGLACRLALVSDK
ncbi:MULTISPECIES: LysE family translocator [Pseudomonas]|uniref:LysE family translocator n=1 Tax=Pseudomonas TaxID=286 RepID=UPI000408472D|nr:MULTISPECIES: LysE family translocator [Pseudomonas]MCQ3029413.1 LysE family translocator [Pseudomonas syringae]MCD5990800.1 LysE family translocator [Pseudomonas quasicaspiana]MDG6398844.1 LysE family translocator [Pseudomonas quasicaspiana]MDU8362002.1 LysE family translocator [Pseudomonas syringae group sp. J309-1]PHN16547.1 amino acid transporter [Pseudomonas sp. ICMP 561]